MSDAILQLRLEHSSIADVLDLLEDEIQRLQGGAPTDPVLLTLMIDYLRDFPEECHHPKEDLVFRKLQQRDPERAATLVDLGQAHEKLAKLTERVSDEIAREAPTPPLAAILREYLDTYRHHLSGEEREFFPAALDTLTRDDLALLDYELFDRKDPLFNDAAESHFAELRNKIQKRAHDSPRTNNRTMVRSSTNNLMLLRQIDSVKTFNDTMWEYEFQLVPYRAGGYGLELNGRWLVDIPDCDENRAAWCAYFYWKAHDDGDSDC